MTSPALNPDGTPVFPAGAVLNGTGATTIWNMPSGLDPTKPIWFDVGHRTSNEQTVSMRTGHQANVSSHTSYQIMTNPEKVMKQFAAMSFNDPSRFYALQAALGSGPFGDVKATGAFDSDTESALGRAMLQYVKLSQGAGVGVSFTDYLLQTAQHATALSQASQQATANPVVLTDPVEIESAAQQAAQDALGQGLSPDQLKRFVSRFQSAQTAAQTAKGGGTVSTPDLGSEAMAFAQKDDPKAFQENQRTAYLDQLVNLLGGGLTSRPNQQPVASVGGGK